MAAPTSAPCRRARVVPDRSVAPRAPRARPRRERGTTRRPRSRSWARCGRATAGTTSSTRPSSVITAGTSRQRTSVASTATATPMPTPNCLTVGSPLMMKAKKTLTMISAAEVMTRPVWATPSMTACVLSRVRSPGLLDVASSGRPRSPSTGRRGSRTSSAGRSSRSGPRRRGRRACTPQPFSNTAVTTPNAAPIEMRFMTPAVSGMTIERNASSSSRKLSADDDADREHEAARRSRRRGRRSPRSCRRRRRSCPAPFVAAGIVSSRSVPHEALGRLVRRRGRRGRGHDRRGARVVDERLGDRVDAGGLLQVVAQVLAGAGRSPAGRPACAGRRPAARSASSCASSCGWTCACACAGPGRAARPGPRGSRGLLLLRSAFCLACFFWSDSCLSILSSCSWSAFAGFLRQVDADEQRAVGADAEPGRHPVVGLPRLGARRQRAVVLLAEVEVEHRQRERDEDDERDERRTAAGGARRTAPSAPSRAGGRPSPSGGGAARARRCASPTIAEQRRQQRDRRDHRDRARRAPPCSRAS